MNLSTVISEALSEGLRLHEATERSEEVLNAYRKAFSGFTEVEMALLDGIILEPCTEALIRDRSRVWAFSIRYQRRELAGANQSILNF